MSLRDLLTKGCPCGCGATFEKGSITLTTKPVIVIENKFISNCGYSGYWTHEIVLKANEG